MTLNSLFRSIRITCVNVANIVFIYFMHLVKISTAMLYMMISKLMSWRGTLCPLNPEFPMPRDLVIGDVYIPPLLAAAVLALVLAAVTKRFMEARGVIHYFANPALVFLSLTTLYTVLLGTFIFRT